MNGGKGVQISSQTKVRRVVAVADALDLVQHQLDLAPVNVLSIILRSLKGRGHLVRKDGRRWVFLWLSQSNNPPPPPTVVDIKSLLAMIKA